MGNIVLLDDNTINKIAAGEVVDRPASIVKELVENSIDAHSKNITVEIKNGGISYIKVQDDGDGFKADDTEMAFERHATSKIRTEADILKIMSMGFRGEALASIAAVSKVMLITRNKDEQVGTKVTVENGKILSKEKTASNQGSTIYIKDVFFNVPARFKFLKKDYTEAGYIEENVIRLALAHPDVSIKYINNGKTIVFTNGDGKITSVIYSIFGKEAYENILEVEYTYEDVVVNGIIGLPTLSRSSRTNEYTFINSRFVKDKVMSSAIEKAYTEKLAINKFPFACININIAPDTVDVNVHPAKLEVKFQDENKIFEAIYFAIKSRLEKENEEKSPFSVIQKETQEFTSNKVDNLARDIIENKNNTSSLNEITVEDVDNIVQEEVNQVDESVVLNDLIYEEKNVSYHDNITKVGEKENIFKDYDTHTKDDEITIGEEQAYKYVGQVFNTYIVIEIKDKMYIIDQHAAHERLLYEEFRTHFYSKEKETQMLLIPMVIELKNSEAKVVEDNIEYFENCGYILEKFTDNSFKIMGVPNIGDIHLEDKAIFMDMVDELLGCPNKTEREEKEFRFLATLACKAAIKGNMKMTKDEHIKLLNDMMKLKNPFTCPHGRPTAIEMSKYDMDKKFDRT